MATPLLRARVHSMRWEAEGVVSVELQPFDDAQFPGFDAGSHIDLHLPNGFTRSYSPCNAASESGRYVVAVGRDRASRRSRTSIVAGRSRCSMRSKPAARSTV